MFRGSADFLFDSDKRAFIFMDGVGVRGRIYTQGWQAEMQDRIDGAVINERALRPFVFSSLQLTGMYNVFCAAVLCLIMLEDDDALSASARQPALGTIVVNVYRVYSHHSDRLRYYPTPTLRNEPVHERSGKAMSHKIGFVARIRLSMHFVLFLILDFPVSATDALNVQTNLTDTLQRRMASTMYHTCASSFDIVPKV